MGDVKRSLVLTCWLIRNFPPGLYPKVADIAGGQGELSLELKKASYLPTLYEMVKGKPHHGVCKIRLDVQELQLRPGEFDLIVGMHPDLASWHILRLARQSQCSFVIVPCCEMYPTGKKSQAGMTWIDWLAKEAQRMGFRTSISLLAMSGKNLLLSGALK